MQTHMHISMYMQVRTNLPLPILFFCRDESDSLELTSYKSVNIYLHAALLIVCMYIPLPEGMMIFPLMYFLSHTSL